MKKGNESIVTPGALKSAEILRLLNCSRSTFQVMLSNGSFPGPDLIIGKNGKRWTRNLFNTWLASRTGTSERGPGRPRGGHE